MLDKTWLNMFKSIFKSLHLIEMTLLQRSFCYTNWRWVLWRKHKICPFPSWFHHDSFWFSLLHQEEFPLTNFWCWDLIKVKILTKNTQKWPFLAFLVFTMSFRTVISQPFLGNICWNFFWNLYRCSKYYFKKNFWV